MTSPPSPAALALARARHPDAPLCKGCGRPIVPGQIREGSQQRHFGCGAPHMSRAALASFMDPSRPTAADIRRGEQLAREHGWE